MKRHRLPFLLSSSLLVALACGSSDDSTFPNDTNGDGGALGDGGTLEDVGFVEPGECASQVLCGTTATCCATGQECVEGACAGICASGVRCGDTCCAGGQVCLNAACIAPGASCQDSFDCAENEFCEPTVGRCLPQPTGENLCIIPPPTPTFAPEVKWSWSSSAIKPDHTRVFSTPIVIDLDGDTIPEVIVVTTDTGVNEGTKAHLRALDGRNGVEKWAATADVYKDEYAVNPRGTPAAANIDGDAAGTIEIITPASGGGVIAFNGRDGSLRWTSKMKDGVTAYKRTFAAGAVALADMDEDGIAEIVVGGVVLDHNGALVYDHLVAENRERWGANAASYGAVSIVADVDTDPTTHKQYVVTGNRAIRKDGTFLWDRSSTASPSVPNPLSDGYAAIADLDGDGKPELVVVYNVGGDAGKSWIRVQDATTGVLLATIGAAANTGNPYEAPGTGQGGPPTIADFDGDGTMDIASANGNRYNVFKFNRTTKALSLLWSKVTLDGSSNVTGSSVFDFEGDGKAEVVYSDECYSRVYRGTDGEVLLAIPNSTGTIHEYPVIADVNGDNRSEYVVVANDFGYASRPCPLLPGMTEKAPARNGVYVYGDPNNKWVRTRRIWNQHAYHITNIESNGRIPSPEPISWGPQGLNNYRVSSQGKGVFNAPDLSVDLEVSTQPCPAGIELRARVKNGGSLGVPAGVAVTFHAGANSQGPVLGQGATTKPLLPGESEVVRLVVPRAQFEQAYFVVVNGAGVDAGAPNGIVDECLFNNNTAAVGGIVCPVPK